MKTRTAALATLTAALVTPATAQPDMRITVEPNLSSTRTDDWSISAEFLSQAPSPIIQVWADTSIMLTGNSPITIQSYNRSYDNALGSSVVLSGNGTSAVVFAGTSNPFFGTPDNSNPLDVITFTYDGSITEFGLELIGQNSAIFDDDSPFNDVRLYQDQLGNPGDLSYEIVIIPAPGTLALLTPAAALLARRRR